MTDPVISDHDLIRNTIALVSVALDTKDWSLLDQSFTSDCTVDYPSPLGITQNLLDLKESLDKAIGHLSTQHGLSTQIIKLTGNRSATCMTYVIGYHYLDDKVFIANAKYDDELVKDQLDGENGWRIKNRKVTVMGVPQGDWSLIK